MIFKPNRNGINNLAWANKYHNRGELYLHHRHEGVNLKHHYAHDTLRNLHRLWTRRILLQTAVEEKKVLLFFDGKGFKERKL